MKPYLVAFLVIGVIAGLIAFTFAPKYYLVTTFPDEKGLSQLGPFASEASCMNMASRLPELSVDMNVKDREESARETVCVPAR